MVGRRLALIAALAVGFAATGWGTAPKNAVQGDGFLAYSQNRSQARSLVRRAEAVQQGFTRLTGIESSKAKPVIIQTIDSSATGSPSAVARVFETDGGGFKVQVDVQGSGGSGGIFETEVARALLLQAMLAEKPPRAGKAFPQPPEWFVEGLAEFVRDRNGTLPPGVDAAILGNKNPPELPRFLSEKTSRMDATTLLLYRVQAAALLRALSKQDGSREKIAGWIVSPSFPDSDLASILEAFPDLKGEDGLLARLWTLEIARASMPPKLSSLSVQATEESLAKALGDSKASDDPPIAESLPARARERGGPHAMRQIEIELLGLEFRSHPLLRPVVSEYRQIAALLARKPKAKVAKRLEENTAVRSLLVERDRQTADYLNWFEATQVNESVDPLLEQTRELSIPPKKDPLTLYLDAFERRGW
ncbi:MAG: hypothetical protein KGR46_03940 [Verrucomicrobia bacterium]|nr:hypothetical protein [Verrucomicrobiota bacterium]